MQHNSEELYHSQYSLLDYEECKYDSLKEALRQPLSHKAVLHFAKDQVSIHLGLN